MKTKLYLPPPFHSCELEDERILCDDVTLPHERHPHNMRLWVVGNEFGALGAVWASYEQDALDSLMDAGLANGLIIEEKDADEDTPRIGNAGDPVDLTHAWIQPVQWDVARDCELLCRFAEARGANQNTLDK